MAYERPYYYCNICCIENYNLLLLLEEERILLQELFQNFCIKNLSPQFVCELCLEQISHVKNLINLNDNKMQNDDNNEKHTDKYNCKCTNCQTKFGGLALLIEGIEKKCAEERRTKKTKKQRQESQHSSHQLKPSTGYQEKYLESAQFKSGTNWRSQSSTSSESTPNTSESTPNTSPTKYYSWEEKKIAHQRTMKTEIQHSTFYNEPKPSSSYQPQPSSSYQPQPSSSYQPQPSTSYQRTSSTSSESSPTKQYGRKEMKCPHCDKTFTHKGDFNKHVRTHTGEQPFPCTMCDRRFSHTSNLIRHLRLHSGSKPFSCDICKKEFSRKDKLDIHQKGKSCKKQ